MPELLLKDLLPVYGISEKTLRRYANEEDVDVWDPIKVADHVASKQRPPRGYIGMEQSVAKMEELLKTEVSRPDPDRQRRPANEDVLPGVSGTLQRLEEAEPDLYEEWQRMRDSGNLAAAKQAHTLWNNTSKTLLDYDLKLDAARKELGEMVAVELVNQFMQALGERLIWSAKASALELWAKLRPILKEDVHPDEFTAEFLLAPVNAVEESRAYFQSEESIRTVVGGFLDEIKSHMVVKEAAAE